MYAISGAARVSQGGPAFEPAEEAAHRSADPSLRVAPDQIAIVRESVATIAAVTFPDAVEVGDIVSVAAHALDVHGSRLDVAIAWSSHTPTLASVTRAGILTAHQSGVAILVASADQVNAEFRVTVVPAVVTRIELHDVPLVLGLQESMPIAVLLQDKRGREVAGHTVQWTSSDSDVVSVAADGTLFGLSSGDATIEARCGDSVATTVVTVGVVPISTLEITGVRSTMHQGSGTRIHAIARDLSRRVRQVPARMVVDERGGRDRG